MPDASSVLEQESQARHPSLVPMANIGVLLTGALLLTGAMFSFVVFMSARERAARESVGRYRETMFCVGRAYWRRERPGYGGLRGSGSEIIRAQGTVEGRREFIDLMPLFTRGGQSQAAIDRLFPPGASIHVYYNPQATGDDRVRFWSWTPPSASAAREARSSATFGAAWTLICAASLLLSIRFRRWCLGSNPLTAAAPGRRDPDGGSRRWRQ